MIINSIITLQSTNNYLQTNLNNQFLLTIRYTVSTLISVWLIFHLPENNRLHCKPLQNPTTISATVTRHCNPQIRTFRRVSFFKTAIFICVKLLKHYSEMPFLFAISHLRIILTIIIFITLRTLPSHFIVIITKRRTLRL